MCRVNYTEHATRINQLLIVNQSKVCVSGIIKCTRAICLVTMQAMQNLDGDHGVWQTLFLRFQAFLFFQTPSKLSALYSLHLKENLSQGTKRVEIEYPLSVSMISLHKRQ